MPGTATPEDHDLQLEY